MSYQTKTFEENYILPQSYGLTNITLIERDPHWVYAYWEISHDSKNKIKKYVSGKLNNVQYVIRMYDVTLIDFNGNNANHFFDVQISPDEKSKYINIWSDNVTYCAALGIITKGQFLALAQSNFITTQRAGLSSSRDMMWMEVKDGKIFNPSILEDKDEISQSKYYKKAKQTVDEANKYFTKTRHQLTRRNVTPDEIRAYYSTLVPMLRRVRPSRGKRVNKSRFGKLKPFLIDEEIEKVPLENLSIFGMNFENMEKIFLGSSAELLQNKAGGSKNLFDTNIAASNQLLKKDHKRNFFFEIGTELIVYGRTEPDASVHLCGKEIKLREDGTFTLRFALPDSGNIPLDFIAKSADKLESRQITTSAQRTKTMYSP